MTTTDTWQEYDGWYETLVDPAELHADTVTAARAAAGEILGYLVTLNPNPADVRIFTCAWLPEYDGIDGPAPAHGWAICVKVTVRAASADPALTGSDPGWDTDAHGIINAGSWTGAEHGWGVGCGHLFTVVPAGQEPVFTLTPLT